MLEPMHHSGDMQDESTLFTFSRASVTGLGTELSHRHFSPVQCIFFQDEFRGVLVLILLSKLAVMKFASLLSPEQLNLKKMTSIHRTFPVLQVERQIVASAIR